MRTGPFVTALAVAWAASAAPVGAQATGKAATPAAAQAPAQAPAQAAAKPAAKPAASSGKTFKAEELDQMLAPIALYPDALLAQVLMATTYPGEVKEAAAWSKANPKASGDSAVKLVAKESWDPSVQSLVAFPAVLAMLGEKPDWVQRIGDAFLAQPDDVMASVQKLRKAAKAAGNLESNEQQKVTVEKDTVIVIQPAQPEVVYVPAYNPTVVYGSWWWPGYPPYYYPPPPMYYPGYAVGVGIAWGVSIGVRYAMWGGCYWGGGGGNVYIDVDRYNNVHVDHRIEGGRGGRSDFQHRPEHRGGAPYRDNTSRDRYGKDSPGKDARQDYRGRDQASTRDAARPTDRAGTQPADARAGARPTDARAPDRARAQQSMERAGISSTSPGGAGGSRGSAMSGVQQPRATASQSARGSASRSSMRSYGGGGGRAGGGRGGRR